MTANEAFLAIAIGFTLEVIAFVNQHFYWTKGWLSGSKETPRWAGRLLFGFVGSLFILFGLRYFVLGY